MPYYNHFLRRLLLCKQHSPVDSICAMFYGITAGFWAMWQVVQQVIPAKGKYVVFWCLQKTPGNYLGHVQHFLEAQLFFHY